MFKRIFQRRQFGKSLPARFPPKPTRTQEMHPETFAITSRWFVPPKVQQTTEKIGLRMVNTRYIVLLMARSAVL
jgi:hypothetical protein